ncbi:hypothetical protein CC85DRAFT_254545 [Cutaneotrichosporon oleaginosum]|uniref:GST N-terminal domain-containing protein n=1 Tax=Cutaneotrichosporon oleaginosum TaxID=879819 RepID=A0A0J1BD78_9TREE|nr:uncharacterized protein CC85DRAFT_254545 [Cutaneotrichosporon oleaginosum]KLT46014.1 hypothetical protein CC85DRAFT_254545 [Cutaneotrichosporon oleaginosum]TXT06708.1 hypothetical protein COLE_06039 [Cutaneotrichosporon oleaginosum]
MPHIVLHHLNQSRSERIFWLLEELNLPYEVKVHFRTPEGRGPPSLKDVSPVGKAPAVTVDGRVLTESGFIAHYLLAHLSQQSGNADLESPASDDSIFWSHFAEGSLMLNLQAAVTAMRVQQGFAAYRSLYLLLFFQRGASALSDFLQKIAQNNVRPMLGEAEAFLEKHRNFSGSDKIGEGDFLMFYPLHSIAKGARKGQYEVGDATKRWIDSVLARPAYQRAVARMEEEEKAQRAKL